MRLYYSLILVLLIFISACATIDENGTLAQLRQVSIKLEDEKIDGGIEKAMKSYQRFLEETPETAMTPEAIRRLADLKIERQNEIMDAKAEKASKQSASVKSTNVTEKSSQEVIKNKKSVADEKALAATGSESDDDFEKRATQSQEIESTINDQVSLADGSTVDMNNVGAKEAIVLYKQLLERFPLYERNDQVLYQMSRAYEEMGEVEEAMVVMNRITREYPDSRYLDEVQFRRAEYFFTRKKFLDAEDAYKAIVKIGDSSFYYDLALYKLGWTFYKQELYEDALQFFMSLLDHKISIGYDFEQTEDKIAKKRIDDTYRVISLSFSNLDGADSIISHFNKVGKKPYEVGVYRNLAEHYFIKRRYGDAAVTYNAFVERNPLHKVSPQFHMRVIDIYKLGNFPKLVLEAKRSFASAYGLKSDYWKHFDAKEYPEAIANLQTNISDLAIHYHSLYRNKYYADSRKENYAEAEHWYREFINSFPKDIKTPKLHFQLAEMLLQGKEFNKSANEYEKVAYNYPAHEKSSQAGYASVYAFRENLKITSVSMQPIARQDVIRSSLKFADAFPEHDKVTIVLAALAEDLFEIKSYELAITTAKKMIDNYPDAESKLRKGAWMIVAHSSYETTQYKNAEDAYLQVLLLTDKSLKEYNDLVNNLAASIYKQGESAAVLQDYKTAADHFLRIAKVAPNSSIRKTAEFDAASVLIKLNDWNRAASVLVAFRNTFNDKQMQHDATKKLAVVYQEAERYEEAAVEFVRIEQESKDNEVRREALILAAQMYEKIEKHKNALTIFQRYVDLFPKPLEFALETRYKMANLYKSWGNEKNYHQELKRVISIDATAGSERTDRTRYLAAKSSLVLAEPSYEKFAAIKLTMPFKRNLKLKQKAMKNAVNDFNKLVKYQVGDVTAAATYYLAEIYYNFSRSLAESERPKDLNEIEKEEYELALEDQIFPFEEKAIAVHRKNLELISIGIYSMWIDKSLDKLGALMPARYAKYEESTGFIESLDVYKYQFIATAVEAPPSPVNNSPSGETDQDKSNVPQGSDESNKPNNTQAVLSVTQAGPDS
ncbi:MAG: tetratricopeptide repeat protein [Gammaproteobacteria bacterium]|nr:tetratricopeptide repeat protein [Gammaproteobacteria bacterium]